MPAQFIPQRLGRGQAQERAEPGRAHPGLIAAPDVYRVTHGRGLPGRQPTTYMEGVITHLPPLPLRRVPDPGELA